MRENVGGADRVARFVIGPVLMGIGLVQLGSRRGRALAALALVAGAAVLESGITRVCPVSRLLGLDTAHPGRRPKRLGALVYS